MKLAPALLFSLWLVAGCVSTQTDLPPLPPRATPQLAVSRAVIKPPPLVTYREYQIYGVDTNNGQPGFAYVPIDIQGSTDFITWTNNSRFWTNADFSVDIPVVDPPHFYRWVWNLRDTK